MFRRDPLGRIRLANLSGVTVQPIEIPGQKKICNPSVAADGDGFRVLLRGVNYALKPNGWDESCIGGIQSTIWLAELDGRLKLLRARKVRDDKYRSGPAARGLEDGRLFRWEGAWWFSATAVSADETVQAVMALCRLDDDVVGECRFIPSPFGHAVEKNWMPVLNSKTLQWIYRPSPLQLLQCSNGGQPELSVLSANNAYESWSGSSHCIKHRGRWLCVVHRKHFDELKRIYEHAFLEISEDFTSMRISRNWYFEHPVVEFCAGLVLSGDAAFISYGVMDREARILKMPLELIDDLFSDRYVTRIRIASRAWAGQRLNFRSQPDFFRANPIRRFTSM